MKNFLILSFAFVIISVAGYYLYMDIHITGENEIQQQIHETIGEMIRAENNVKRQLSQEMLWNPIEAKTPVYNQDSIRTAKDSTAIIKLLDNTIIELSENSLIVLDKNQNNFSIKFKAGDMFAKNSGNQFQILTKDGFVRGQGADVKLNTGSGTQTKVQVLKGKAFVQDRNNKAMQVSENEQTFLDDKGASTVTKMSIVLKSPENKSEISSNSSSMRYTFIWQVLNPQVLTEYFEISKTAAFKKDETKSFRAHQAISAPISQGVNYWRVGWDNAKNGRSYSETRQFTLGHDKRLELIYPENQTNFQFEPADNSLELQWKSLIAVKAYVAEVSRTEDFKSIVLSQPLAGSAAELKIPVKNLDSGTYYWHIKAFGQKNDILGTSNTFSFSIKLKLPSLPELLRPAHEAAWNDSSPVTFSWKKMDTAASYRLVISSDIEQKDIIKTVTTKEGSFVWSSRGQQQVFWSVTSSNAKLASIGKSEVRKLQFQKKKNEIAFILVNPRDRFDVQREISANTDPVLFQWKTTRPLPGPVSLFVSQNEEFKNPVVINNITKYSQEVKLEKAGPYFWRLESHSPSNKDFVEASEVNTFNLKHVFMIAAPELIAPEAKEKIETGEAVVVNFSWKPVTGAVQYHIVVENIDPKTLDKKTVMDKVVKETAAVSSRLPEGQYKWTVSSFDSEGQEGTNARSRDFNIIPYEQVEAPQLNNPVLK